MTERPRVAKLSLNEMMKRRGQAMLRFTLHQIMESDSQTVITKRDAQSKLRELDDELESKKG